MITNFNMADTNITMVKGDTLAFNIEIDGLDGGDLDSASFTCKEIPTSSDAVFRKTLGYGITKVDDGLYCVKVSPTDTENATAGSYYYDCQIGFNGGVYTIMLGMLEILQDVTN